MEHLQLIYNRIRTENVFEHDEKELSLYLDKQIESIQMMNGQQEKGCYSDNASSLFVTAGNIIRKSYNSIFDEELDKLCAEIMVTLNSNKHSFECKTYAMALFCEIAIYRSSSESVNKSLVEILERKESFQNSVDLPFSSGYSEQLFRCIAGILEYKTKKSSDIDAT